MEEENSFGKGFTYGVIAGVAAYYFFGTDPGKKVVKKIKKEWHHYEKKASPEVEAFPLGTFFKRAVKVVIDEFNAPAPTVKTAPKKNTTAKTPPRKKKKAPTPKQFKGV